MSEFDLIKRHFTRPTPGALLGVGDDAALLKVSDGCVLAVSTDMLVAGTHFFAGADPYLLGHKTLAVNLSDLAAMGAAPRWATLAISMPYCQINEPLTGCPSHPHPNPPPDGEGTEVKVDEAWLAAFSAGFFALAQQHGVDLVGGDTTRGPLNLCVTIFGEVPLEQALRRSGAQVGDEIWVSGRLGDAALALAHLQGRIVLTDDAFAASSPALHQPQPRVALGLALRDIAHSAIDVSDGLLADLGHILEASQVGAVLDFSLIPVSTALRSLASRSERHPHQSDNGQLPPLQGEGLGGEGVGCQARAGLQQRCVLAGGDDYELCFTVPAARHGEVLHIAAQLDLPLTRIGNIVAGRGCVVHDAALQPINLEGGGYDHFR